MPGVYTRGRTDPFEMLARHLEGTLPDVGWTIKLLKDVPPPPAPGQAAGAMASACAVGGRCLVREFRIVRRRASLFEHVELRHSSEDYVASTRL